MLCSAGLAQTQAPAQCADSDYVLETPEGILGGANLEFDESNQTSVFSDGACLEAKGIKLWAPELRWDEKAQTLRAESLEVQTSRYRFRARSGTVKDQVFTALGVIVTTCKCGDDLRVLAEEASFDSQSGNILFEQAGLQLYGLELARLKRYELDTSKPPTFGLPTASSGVPGEPDTIRIPIVLGLGNGPNIGLRDFPWLGDSKGSSSFSMVGYNLGSSAQELRFGIAASRPGTSARVEVAVKSGQPYFFSVVNQSPLHFSLDSEKQLYTARLQQIFRYGGLTLTPFAAIASELEQRTGKPPLTTKGPSLGGELRYRLQLHEGAFGFRLEPFSSFTLYDAPFYWAYGGQLEARYEAGFSLRLAYEHSENFENRDSRFGFERRNPKSLVSAAFTHQSISLQASYDFLLFESKASTRYGFGLEDGELWTEGRIRFTEGNWTQQELVLGFNPRPLDCTYSYSLSPKLGYDLLRQGFSRLGLEARYADCCFVWKLGYEAVLIPQNSDDSGRFVFGVEVR